MSTRTSQSAACWGSQSTEVYVAALLSHVLTYFHLFLIIPVRSGAVS